MRLPARGLCESAFGTRFTQTATCGFIQKMRLSFLREPHSRPLPDAVESDPPGGPPRPVGLLGELRAAVEPWRLIAASPRLAKAPRGRGQRVIDLPGWRAPEASNLPLRTYLRALGYDARAWGLGVNRGTPEADAEKLAAELAADPDAPPIALVGWSLGGTIAREIARAVPDRIACVITYGSPVIGGPTHTLGADSFGPEECARVDRLVRRYDTELPIKTPITAILTRRDAVVDWRACVDRSSIDVRHVEVTSTHLSMGFDPDVWSTVAQTLHDHLR